jgi:hypothetical protein
MTTTDKLAAALAEIKAACEIQGAQTKPLSAIQTRHVYTTARTALAEYEADREAASDPHRALAVGDRVRVVAPHALTGFYYEYGLGTELVVKELGTGTLLRCATDDAPLYCLNFSPYELQRIPTTKPEKQA